MSAQLKAIFQRTNHFQLASPTLAHLREMSEYCKRFGVRTKMYIVPLWSWNEVFFAGGIMFSCLFDRRSSKEIFAAGGRYDALIKEQRPRISTQFEERHAVGFGFNWERLAQAAVTTTGGASKALLRKRAAAEEAQGIFATKRVSTGSTTNPSLTAVAIGYSRGPYPMSISMSRNDADRMRGEKCDVLVASFDPTLLRTAGIDVLQMLWAQDISAELARDARSPEELVTRHRDDSHCWHVIVKQPDMLKVKTPGRKDAAPDADMAPSQLCQWLRAEKMRERESAAAHGHAEGSSSIHLHHYQHHHHHQHQHQHQQIKQQEVRVLMAQTRSKKPNRQALVEQAQAAASRLVSGFLAGPVAAIETTDAVMDLIRSTALSDAESWRRAEQAVGTSERKYMREVHEMLDNFKAEAESSGGGGDAGAAAAVGGGGGGGGFGGFGAGSSSSGMGVGGGGGGGAGSGAAGPFMGAGSYGGSLDSGSGGGGGGAGSSAAFGMSHGGGGGGVRAMPAFVYNFRTGSCLYYDLAE